MKLFHNGIWAKLILVLILFLEVVGVGVFMGLLAFGAFTRDNVVSIIFYVTAFVIDLIVSIHITNSESEPSYKIAWLFVVGILPYAGATYYIFFAHKRTTKRQERELRVYYDSLHKEETKKEDADSFAKEHPNYVGLAEYLGNTSKSTLYADDEVKYYPLGDDALEDMLSALESAKHYILIEFFIIAKGEVWNKIEEILIRKATLGVEVKLIYDAVGSLTYLPVKYDEYLRSKGIDCRVFHKLHYVFDIRYNCRDHRKIMVIDGHTAFTGGINLADEYFNKIARFGHWKDNAIRVRGRGVQGYTSLFLANYYSKFGSGAIADYSRFGTYLHLSECDYKPTKGYLMSYGQVPYNRDDVGVDVYLELIARAQKSIYAVTPYLIMDYNLTKAFVRAAKKGVKVVLLTPAIPDKKTVYQLTRASYGKLLDAGCKVYEYTPGFVHSKMFVIDEEVASIGTLNLDYRSLYLHMENGTLLFGKDYVLPLKEDYEKTLLRSHEVKKEEWMKWKKKKEIYWATLRVLAPLL